MCLLPGVRWPVLKSLHVCACIPYNCSESTLLSQAEHPTHEEAAGLSGLGQKGLGETQAAVAEVTLARASGLRHR